MVQSNFTPGIYIEEAGAELLLWFFPSVGLRDMIVGLGYKKGQTTGACATMRRKCARILDLSVSCNH